MEFGVKISVRIFGNLISQKFSPGVDYDYAHTYTEIRFDALAPGKFTSIKKET